MLYETYNVKYVVKTSCTMKINFIINIFVVEIRNCFHYNFKSLNRNILETYQLIISEYFFEVNCVNVK